MDGRWHRHIEECHNRYGKFYPAKFAKIKIVKVDALLGDVFRVSPDELSFCTPDAWTDIYGPGSKGVGKILKNEFYEVFGSGFEVQSLGTERDPVQAQKKRALFANALSVKGLAQQEPIMQDHIDIFVDKLGKLGNNDAGIDMSKWFIYIGFDIIGQMSFGDSFGCVERGE
jgi:hypothetical protein